MTIDKRHFFDGWTIFGTAIIILCGLAVHWNTTGDSPLPMSNWWWMTFPVVLVYGARAYQFFVQKK